MESRWRRNVWEFGLSMSFYGKIARLVGQPGIAITDGATFAPEIAATVYSPLLDGQWASYSPVLKIDPAANFPYGFIVEPDH